MAQRTIPCGEAPQLTIRAERNLSIRGGQPNEIQATIEDLGDLQAVSTENNLILTCEDDCALEIPLTAKVVVEETGGSLSISDFTGGLEIREVNGNLSLYRIGDVECKTIDGNCRVEGAGRVQAQGVGGNLKGSELRGPLNVTGVGGNIKLAIAGSVEKLRAGGNIKIGILAINNDVEMSAGGNIHLYLPHKPGFVLDAASGGHNVIVRLGESTRKFRGAVMGEHFGDGGAKLILHAGGNVMILDTGLEAGETEEIPVGGKVDMDTDWSTMNERIHKRIHERVERAEKRAEAVRRRAEENVRLAMKSVEGFDFSGVIDASLRSAGWPFAAADSSASFVSDDEPADEREKVTDAERMIILNMLHEKKITAEEAERLLDALEGRFHYS